MLQNGVIETATGDLLRAGFCDFENDGSFDAGTETYRTDVPHPAQIRGDPDNSQMHRWTGSWVLVSNVLPSGSSTGGIVESAGFDQLSFTFQNNGAVLNTGVQSASYLRVPFDCTIVAARVFGGPSGSIVADLWKDVPANYPPTDADSITASAPPTISGGVKSEDETLTGWSKDLTENDGILANIDSVATMIWAKVVLDVVKR